MKHEAVFRFRGESSAEIYQAVKPELEDLGRTSVNLRLDNDGTLVLEVKAADVSAMRAALNTWLRLINVAKEIQEIV